MKNDHEVLTAGMFKELLREFMAPEFEKVQQEFDKVRVETKQEFEKVRTETKQEFEKMRVEVSQEFDKVRAETKQEFEKMRVETKQELAKVRIEIRDDIIDVIDQNIQPQITSAVSRITRLERKIA